jgi:putative peptide zinc metalloprotease protein
VALGAVTEKVFLSANWYRVGPLRLRLRAHARFHRTLYRGQVWYVLQDRSSGRFHRFSPEAYLLVGLLDGQRTMEQVWEAASARLGDDALTQQDVIRLLGQLHAADVLFGDVPPDIADLSERGRRQRRRKLAMSVLNPMALRLPVFDPDALLSATAPLARLVFSRLGGLAFLVLLAWALLLAGQHWPRLSADVADQVLATENLLLLLVTYPLVKALHELGHAYAVKRWGGEVHEIGLMFLVFIPVPYVDASDSMSFPDKWKRALVGGAGILVELGLAALAMIVWANAEPGLVRAFAFNVMLIGGISTVLFNGNPLLRFDGYYVLSDLIEIPNLAQRANAYVLYLAQRFLFGLDAASPVTAPGERGWLFCYAIAAFAYRLVLVFTIALIVGTQFFIFGVLIALWSVLLMLGLPLVKFARFLVSGPALRRQRGRALAVTSGGVLAAFALLFVLPLPHATVAEGVVGVRGEATLHAGVDGTVVALHQAPGTEVAVGTAILALEDPALAARARMLAGRVAELEAQHAMRDLSDPVRARITLEELNLARADLEAVRERLSNLTLRSRAAGQLSLHRPEHLIGRHVRRGDLLGHVVPEADPVIRVVVPESEADLVLRGTTGVALRRASERARVLPASVERIAPRLEESLPSLALATGGGGGVSMDPTDPARQRTIGRFLQLDLALAAGQSAAARFGERVHVRFAHAAEPMAWRLWRGLRQVFLKHFSV